MENQKLIRTILDSYVKADFLHIRTVFPGRLICCIAFQVRSKFFPIHKVFRAETNCCVLSYIWCFCFGRVWFLGGSWESQSVKQTGEVRLGYRINTRVGILLGHLRAILDHSGALLFYPAPSWAPCWRRIQLESKGTVSPLGAPQHGPEMRKPKVSEKKKHVCNAIMYDSFHKPFSLCLFVENPFDAHWKMTRFRGYLKEMKCYLHQHE